MHKARGFSVTAAIAALFLGAPAAFAADRESLDARFEQAKPVEVGVDCGDVITQHTRITHDLSCPGTDEPALRIEGEGIVLDLGGHTVRRSSPVQQDTLGIVVTGTSMVRNGTIRGFARGIQTEGVDSLRLHQLTFTGNGTAIYNSFSTTSFLVTNSRFIGNDVGLGSEIDASLGTFDVRSSHFENNRLGIYLDTHDADVLDSTFMGNEVGVYCFAGSVRVRSSTFARNEAVASTTVPIGGRDICNVFRFEDTLIADNASFAPTETPILNVIQLDMINNWIVGNDNGLTAGSFQVYIQGNTFWDNAGGLTLEDTPIVSLPQTGIVRANRFLRNDGDGLRILPASTPTVIGNVAQGNTGWGIHAPTAFDGGGNVARDNGAGNCEGITCAPY
ncbi:MULTISPECIES: right-handed parallel beta-helix repeat-containing protein [unclassified Corallococcus]|uniref:right-handed parallel beta-helix repeat-containing protein n=1 Tax=unclassified Corallococcus TaxID=2685029 RepID=UPI001A8CCAC7|nr:MULTISPECIES: right-handed parallel beta-helix repeat-containing protein [unclassified Corallococcus]MBN9684426.1 right-handed parallel beta-helix repeat-containing protein [Corallococcus sp. NCSPR001]WAS84097.1 right-handed parallel beta-helix repeat-containing protein [Corallococcus sp. NCRR]